MIIFIRVPMPGFCFKKNHKKSTQMLIKKVDAPIVKPLKLEIPSARTDQGELPVVDNNNKPSPNPNKNNPKQRKKKVDNRGLVLSAYSELHFFFGILFILKTSNKI
tara:strand:+ start:167 stop:484 length:318 start_codon:yes stop_codon:yes gene_type:complete